MRNTSNTWKYIVGTAIAAIAEVSVTAVLVDKLGVLKLVGMYVVTTGMGGLVIWTYYSKQQLIMNKIKSMERDSFPDTVDEVQKNPEALYFGELGMAMGYFWIAVVLIVIPGIVTDILGLALLVKWIVSHTVRSFDPSYVPKKL